jgi:hypothetical protein
MGKPPSSVVQVMCEEKARGNPLLVLAVAFNIPDESLYAVPDQLPKFPRYKGIGIPAG